jgi:cell wall-associated NlpC family hydrolase
MRKFDGHKAVKDARSLVGTETRWRHQGRDPQTGLDCVGLPRWMFIQQMGQLPDALEIKFSAYHRRPDGQELLQTIREWFDEVPRSDMREGDLVVIYERRNPQHIAIACDNIMIVEAYASGRNMKIVYWKLATLREIAGVFRFPTEGEKAAKWHN